MTERQGPEQSQPDDPRRGSAPSSADLVLESRAVPLLARLADDDGSSLELLIDLLGERVHALQDLALDAVGLCADPELSIEWFTSLALGDGDPHTSHPLADALAWMTARARATVQALAARPLPWEDGYSPGLPGVWLERCGVQGSDDVELYVSLVSLHRLPETVRRVMRQLTVTGLLPAACAHSLSMTEAEVMTHWKRGRMELVEALERLRNGGADE